MLTEVEYDQNIFVESLVKAAHEMQGKDVKPTKFTIPETTFKHFKKSIIYEGFFKDHTEWQKTIWNSKHNPINFDKPMFMGLFVDVVPDAKDKRNICYLHTGSNYRDMKIPFEYSLDKVRKHKIKSNLVIIVKSRADIFYNAPKNEWHAAELLREMITETEFRKYMKYGFILVKGRSGRVYQIFRYKDHTKVWEKGKLVEEVCVRIKRSLNVPPTDNVIAFRTMILCDENEFKKLGNVYNMAEAA